MRFSSSKVLELKLDIPPDENDFIIEDEKVKILGEEQNLQLIVQQP